MDTEKRLEEISVKIEHLRFETVNLAQILVLLNTLVKNARSE